MAGSVSISLKLDCFVRQDGQKWISLCPGLNVASQGSTEEGAIHSLREAVEVWVESCLERGTLEKALQESGFRLVAWDAPQKEGADEFRVVDHGEDTEVLGNPFPVEVTIPAYQAALLKADKASIEAR